MELEFFNQAYKVADLDQAEEHFGAMPGAVVVTRHSLGDGSFLEVRIGAVPTNVFDRALYEDDEQPLPLGHLHTSYFVADLEAALANPFWSATPLLWGPATIEGGFGRRRIVFFEPLPGVRIELMEDLADG